MKNRHLKRIVALIAALSMLLCSSALAANLFVPDDIANTVNALLPTAFDSLTDDPNTKASLTKDIRVSYDTDSTAGDISYWNDDYTFCISLTADSRTSKGTDVHFFLDISESSATTILPVVPVVMAVSQLDPTVDASAFLNWILAQEDGSRFESSKWDAYMSVDENGEYMGFMLFAY